MTNEKEFGSSEEGGGDRESAPRARNRTVMLSPEMTGAVRARIAQGLGHMHQNQSGYVVADKPEPTAARSAGGQSPVHQPLAHQQQVSYGGYHPEGTDTPHEGASSVAIRNSGSPVGYQPKESQQFDQSFTHYQRVTPIVGFLVSFDTKLEGEIFELRSGRLIITSDRSTPGSIMYVSDPTVSPSHAILRITLEGEIQVLDQLSEFGTRVECRETGEAIELSGDKSALAHGDILQLGERRFHVCLVVQASNE